MDAVKRLPVLYCLWAALAVAISVAAKGLSPENLTRLLVLGFLGLQVVFRSAIVRSFPKLSPRARFVVLATLFAAVVEGLHMISVPVFPSLRVSLQTPFATAVSNYLLDLAFTIPAYLVIFSVIWHFLSRYAFGFWPYTLAMGLAQTLGDGGLFFFAAAPALLLFLPYPMTNYHAVNVLPFLSVRDQLPPNRSPSRAKYLAIPAVILTYLICGALIQIVGKVTGFRGP